MLPSKVFCCKTYVVFHDLLNANVLNCINKSFAVRIAELRFVMLLSKLRTTRALFSFFNFWQHYGPPSAS